MPFHPRIDTTPLVRNGSRARIFPVLPWVFIIGVAAGTIAATHGWRPHLRLPASMTRMAVRSDEELFWRRAGNPDTHFAVTVTRIIDGDTFEAKVAPWPSLVITTRVRLRGIDAPELHARCGDEYRGALAAKDALEALLDEGGVTISNVGPDKYEGRVDADVATARTPNVSAKLLEGGYGRPYDGGHRDSWCAASWR